ncbi:hypothetical protein NS2R_19860 [Pseudomonas oryzihabitans]|nr:hypothetical protein NS2R_19860 [Pseudomonas psychrotolerans]
MRQHNQLRQHIVSSVITQTLTKIGNIVIVKASDWIIQNKNLMRGNTCLTHKQGKSVDLKFTFAQDPMNQFVTNFREYYCIGPLISKAYAYLLK